MWLLFYVCAYVCASASGETPLFRKCCSRDHSLIRVSEIESEEHFECLDRESAEIRHNISHAPLIVGDGVTVESGIPESCDDLRVVHLTSTELNSRLSGTTDQCYDRLVLEIVNGSTKPSIPKIVALTCIQNEEKLPDVNLSIDHIRKCCPKGQSYDSAYHLCKKSDLESSEEWLVGKLNVGIDFIYAVENGLHCKADEYGVELSDSLYSLEVNRSGLRVVKRSGEGGGLALQGEWCVDREYGQPGLVARVCTRDCGAYGAFCVRKCCPFGQHFRVRRCDSFISKCVSNDDEIPFDIDDYMQPVKEYGIGELNKRDEMICDEMSLSCLSKKVEHMLSVRTVKDVLGIRTELRCPAGRVVLNRSQDHDYHQLTTQGFLDSAVATDNEYCLEAFDSRHCPGGDITVTAVICFIKGLNKDFRVSFVLNVTSCVCLALTLVVYCALPELRNLHGRTLVCHVSMMLLAFSCLARVQYSEGTASTSGSWQRSPGSTSCASTYGGHLVQPMRKAGSDRRRFLWYSLYAWTITIILTLTMFLLDRYPVARVLDANIGNGMCWFGSVQNSRTDWPHYIFFVIPMGLGTCTNLVLFLLTARHCARVKSEVHRMQAGSVGDRAKRRFRVDRAKYVLTGKLWVVMGAGWISELLATVATHPEWLWSIVDLFNELQGVLIFLILIFKPKLYYLIRKRLGLEKPDAQKQGTSSGRTSSTFLSRTISSDERATLRISQGNNVKQP
ncbi:G-protein coupled receptor Mth2 [Operophtera brumata]|uniref:G-protein coupled receptor Mth2 n=1 Tax=Operophtera brumata TaxID=104452 RepID=A0A0L7LC34_OPEBR|nr:G-protein coupled receptor Mth2 [Operophtera brumata]